MLKLDKDALICDLAETYGIYDWRSLPVRTVATLSAGLRDDSRIMMKLSGQTVSARDQLLAGIFDHVALIMWSKTKDAEHNRNRPKSILMAMLHPEGKGNNDLMKYASGEDFMKDRERILAVIKERGSDGD